MERSWTIQEWIKENNEYTPLKNIEFYNDDKNLINDYDLFDIYNYTKYLNIHNYKELKALTDMANAFGFSLFMDIDQIGYFSYKPKYGKFMQSETV